MLIDIAMHRIRSYAEQKGWSAEKYGSAAGVPPSTARDVLKARGNPTAGTIRAMEAVIPPRWKPTDRSPASPTCPPHPPHRSADA